MIDRNNCYFCGWYYEESDTGFTECRNTDISDESWEKHFVDEIPNCPCYKHQTLEESA